MPLPVFWRRASFTVPEVAELIGTLDATLRSYMVRSPTNDFLGAKTGGRIYLSAQDAFYYQLVSELIRYGVPSRAAMLTAGQIANDCDDGLPREHYLVVRTGDGKSNFHLTDDLPTEKLPALVLPIRAMAEVLIADAAEVYASEAA